MSEVADLFASLGLRVNQAEWNKGNDAIRKAKSALEGLDRAADKFAATQKAAAVRERETARAQQRAIAAVSLDRNRAARAQKQQEDKQAAERQKLIDRTVTQGQYATAIIGGLGLYFGQRVVRAGIQFNATMEDSKNEVAGMLALAHKSDLSTELKTADGLVENLRERASRLPGTTMEYIQMLSMITQPITDAKLGLKDLEDMTVASVVAAKGLHVPWEVAARDIDQAIRGQFHSVDPFSGKVLGSIGYKGEEGRSRFNSLTQEKRATEFRRALAQPQFAQLGEAAGQSFSGVLSTLEDAWQHFQGMLAKPLFEALTVKIKELNSWLERNRKSVEEFAKSIGEDLVAAFGGLVAVFQFLVEHGDMVTAILVTIGALMAAFAINSIIALWPLYAIAAVVGLIAYGIIKLIKHWDAVKDAAVRAGRAIRDGIAAAFNYIAELPLIAQLIALVRAAERLANIGPKKAVGAAEGAIDKATRSLADGFTGILPPDIRSRIQAQPAIPGRPGAGAANAALTVNGGVNVSVNSPNADPGAVAKEVGRHFDNKMGIMLREAHDVVAP